MDYFVDEVILGGLVGGAVQFLDPPCDDGLRVGTIHSIEVDVDLPCVDHRREVGLLHELVHDA